MVGQVSITFIDLVRILLVSSKDSSCFKGKISKYLWYIKPKD